MAKRKVQKDKQRSTNHTHDTKDLVTICASDNPVNETYSEWRTGYCISDKHSKITKTKTKNVETYKFVQWNNCEM